MTDEPTERPVRDVPHALDDFEALLAAVGDRRPALFLDYDGTLTPIVERPDLAVLSEEGRRMVAETARRLPTAVVSGRDRPDVEKLVDLEDMIYAGSHGFDIRLPDGRILDHGMGEDVHEHLHRAVDQLRERLMAVPGALVEAKKFSVAAHYRQVNDDDYPAFRAAVDAVMAEVPGLKEKPGKKVVEIQPDFDWDKGKAVDWLLKTLALDGPDVAAFFFGDDVTDEDAFRALWQRDGIGVVAATADEDRTTTAHFRVDDPGQVHQLLGRLGDAFGR